MGSVGTFSVGRRLGAHYVRSLVSQATWDKMGFIVEAEAAILCFIIYLIPGLPKDMVAFSGPSPRRRTGPGSLPSDSDLQTRSGVAGEGR